MFREHVYVTNGWNTKQYRKEHAIGKGHGRDVYRIACGIIQGQPYVDAPEEEYLLLQFRRHDRANIKAQKERTTIWTERKLQRTATSGWTRRRTV